MFFSRRQVLKSASVSAFAAAASAVGAQSTSSVQVAMIEVFSGPASFTGESVFRNLAWAIERVNSRGGVRLQEGGRVAARPLALKRYDSKGQVEDALVMLRSAIDDGAQIVVQGNSSGVAAALSDAIGKHNEREPQKRVVFLNYSALDPILTNERCSPWHFRFDAHADMRMTALMSVLKDDMSVKSVYLFGQDYSFGQAVLREARRQLPLARPDVKVVGDELHAFNRIKDFTPYATKLKASGADAVMTGNWGNDLTLFVKAARDAGFEGKFYTFYGNALGVPTVIGEAGVGKVIAVADWLPNLPTAQSEAFVKSFRERFPNPKDDYVHMRMQLMIEALAQSLEGVAVQGAGIDVLALRAKLAKANVSFSGQSGQMRAEDGQFQQSLVVGVMDKLGSPGVKFDVEGSGYGFRVVKVVAAKDAQMAHSCKMAAV